MGRKDHISIDRGLKGLIDKIESWPVVKPVTVATPQQDLGAAEVTAVAAVRSRTRTTNVRFVTPMLTSSVRAPKTRKSPAMASSLPQRFDPDLKSAVGSNLAPGCHRGAPSFASSSEPGRGSAPFLSQIPRNIPFSGSGSPYVWRPTPNTSGSPYTLTGKVDACKDLLSVQRRGVPGSSPFLSIATRFGDYGEELWSLRSKQMATPPETPVEAAPVWDDSVRSEIRSLH